MIAFETVHARSASMSLDEVVERLRDAPRVAAVAALGSTASGDVAPASDVDLLVVLDAPREHLDLVPGTPFEIVFTYVDGRAADVIVTTVDGLAASEHEPLVRWAAEGRVLFDRGGALARLRDEDARRRPPPWPEGAAYSSWWSISFEVTKAQRYAALGAGTYLDAAAWIATHAALDSLVAYFQVRELPWRGEREALAYWAREDPAFLSLFEAFGGAQSVAEKVHACAALAARALDPAGGLWAPGTGPRSETWEELVGPAGE